MDFPLDGRSPQACHVHKFGGTYSSSELRNRPASRRGINPGPPCASQWVVRHSSPPPPSPVVILLPAKIIAHLSPLFSTDRRACAAAAAASGGSLAIPGTADGQCCSRCGCGWAGTNCACALRAVPDSFEQRKRNGGGYGGDIFHYDERSGEGKNQSSCGSRKKKATVLQMTNSSEDRSEPSDRQRTYGSAVMEILRATSLVLVFSPASAEFPDDDISAACVPFYCFKQQVMAPVTGVCSRKRTSDSRLAIDTWSLAEYCRHDQRRRTSPTGCILVYLIAHPFSR